jgi:hypothetical protein
VQRLALHLIDDGLDDFRIAMADVKDSEAAQTIDILSSVNVAVRVGTGVGPLYNRAGAVR